MKVLLTGANGYIGRRLLPVLVKMGHEVVCCVRDKSRFEVSESLQNKVEIIEIDLLDRNSLLKIPDDIQGAYYLVHSMTGGEDYDELEKNSAINFREALRSTKAKHVVYLGAIVNEEKLSKHLASRKAVEEELSKGLYGFTSIRAGIIIGSGSASFEIIRDLVEKLPVMVAPKWLNTKSQPIAINDVIDILSESLFVEALYNGNYDIGGPDIISYKEMLLGYAKVRGVKRRIITVPVMTPRLSSYWLYFITATSYKLAQALVGSMKIEVVCRNNEINKILSIQPVTYYEALQKTVSEIEHNSIVSSWKDAFISGGIDIKISDYIQVPSYGCYTDVRVRKYRNRLKTIDKIWEIGGDNGWYYATWLWQLRGLIDRLFGGVGLRRGRKSNFDIDTGDSIDFWRVLFADREEGRLLLFAEMRLPGEAWLEFRIDGEIVKQTATYRPKGLWGRLYWIMVLPLHGFIFRGLLKKICN